MLQIELQNFYFGLQNLDKLEPNRYLPQKGKFPFPNHILSIKIRKNKKTKNHSCSTK
jgi:hypothetical protein